MLAGKGDEVHHDHIQHGQSCCCSARAASHSAAAAATTPNSATAAAVAFFAAAAADATNEAAEAAAVEEAAQGGEAMPRVGHGEPPEEHGAEGVAADVHRQALGPRRLARPAAERGEGLAGRSPVIVRCRRRCPAVRRARGQRLELPLLPRPRHRVEREVPPRLEVADQPACQRLAAIIMAMMTMVIMASSGTNASAALGTAFPVVVVVAAAAIAVGAKSPAAAAAAAAPGRERLRRAGREGVGGEPGEARYQPLKQRRNRSPENCGRSGAQ